MRIVDLFDDNIAEIAGHLNDVDCTMWALSCRWAYRVPGLRRRCLRQWVYLVRVGYQTGTRRQCVFIDSMLAGVIKFDSAVVVRWQGYLLRHAAMTPAESRDFWLDRPAGLPHAFVYMPARHRFGVLSWMLAREGDYHKLCQVLVQKYAGIDAKLKRCKTLDDIRELAADFRGLVETCRWR